MSLYDANFFLEGWLVWGGGVVGRLGGGGGGARGEKCAA